MARVDYNLNEHNNLSAEFFDGNGPTLEPVSNVTQPYWETPLDVRTSVVRGWWTWIPSSTWVNDLRFGWDNSRSTNSPSYDCTTASGADGYCVPEVCDDIASCCTTAWTNACVQDMVKYTMAGGFKSI